MSMMLDVLAEKHAINIILLLNEQGPMNINSIIKAGYGSGIVVRRVRELEQAGLVSVKQSKTWPFTKTVMLTEEGKKVAKYLLEMTIHAK